MLDENDHKLYELFFDLLFDEIESKRKYSIDSFVFLRYFYFTFVGIKSLITPG